MFVYIKFEDSFIIDYFGPATQSECEAWMRLKKIYPRDSFINKKLLLKNNETNPKLLSE